MVTFTEITRSPRTIRSGEPRSTTSLLSRSEITNDCQNDLNVEASCYQVEKVHKSFTLKLYVRKWKGS